MVGTQVLVRPAMASAMIATVSIPSIRSDVPKFVKVSASAMGFQWNYSSCE